MHVPILLVATVATVAIAAPTQQFQITPQLQIAPATSSTYPQTAVAVGDLDGDGRDDLVAIVDTMRPQVFLSDGRQLVDRTFGRMPAGNVLDLGDLALGDVDGDGDLDLVVANSWLGQVRLLANNGSAVFTEVTATHLPAMTPFGDWVYTAALFDADGDGDLDLFAGVGLGDRLLQNDGTGHFTDVTATSLPATSRDSWRATVGDLDADGDLDLVTWNAATSPRLTCLHNDGHGVFTAYNEPLLTAAEASFGVGIADLNGDGYNDVLTNGCRRLLFGTSNGLLDMSPTHLPVHGAGTSRIADIDADGDLDVVGAQFLLVNDGTGLFADATASRYQPAPAPRALLAVGDFDGDRDADVIAIDGWFLAGYANGIPTFPPRVLSNRHRHLAAPSSVARGQSLLANVAAAPGYGTGAVAALPFLALQPSAIPIPDLGCVGLQPSTMVAIPLFVVIPSPAGLASFVLPIPNHPQLANLPIWLQTLTVDPGFRLRLTNTIEVRIL